MLRKIINPRVISAVVSALGAIVSAIFATGCVLRVREVGIKDFDAEIFSDRNARTTSCFRVVSPSFIDFSVAPVGAAATKLEKAGNVQRARDFTRARTALPASQSAGC